MIPMSESTNLKGNRMAIDPALLEEMLFLPRCYFDYVGDGSHTYIETSDQIRERQRAIKKGWWNQ